PSYHSTLPSHYPPPLASLRSLLLFSCLCHHRHLHSFPTRRSSDLDRLTAELAFRADLARDARHFGGEGVELVDHAVHDLGREQQDRKSTRLNLQSLRHLVCRLLLEKKKKKKIYTIYKIHINIV